MVRRTEEQLIAELERRMGLEPSRPTRPDPMAEIRQREQQVHQELKADLRKALAQDKAGQPDAPWMEHVPNPRVKTGKQVLTEFVPGTVETAPMDVPTPSLSVGQQAPQYDLSAIQHMDTSRVSNALPPGAMADYMRSRTPEPAPAATDTIVTDTPGSLYVSLAEPAIETAKMSGHRNITIDMEVGRQSTTFPEFRAQMRSQGYEVEIADIRFGGSGQSYSVRVSW